MKTKSLQGVTYESPDLAALEIKSEGVLCASGDKWYEKGSQGDFTFDLETDDTWA